MSSINFSTILLYFFTSVIQSLLPKKYDLKVHQTNTILTMVCLNIALNFYTDYLKGCNKCVKFGPSNGSSTTNAEMQAGMKNSLWPISKSNTNILFHFLKHLLIKYCIIVVFPTFLYPANRILMGSGRKLPFDCLNENATEPFSGSEII